MSPCLIWNFRLNGNCSTLKASPYSNPSRMPQPVIFGFIIAKWKKIQKVERPLSIIFVFPCIRSNIILFFNSYGIIPCPLPLYEMNDFSNTYLAIYEFRKIHQLNLSATFWYLNSYVANLLRNVPNNSLKKNYISIH